MIKWARQFNGTDYDLTLWKNEVLVGWRLAADAKTPNTWQVEWAGEKYWIKKINRFTYCFVIDDQFTGLACTLVFHWTGNRARLKTNTGGKLKLKRISLRKRTWNLYDGQDTVLFVDAREMIVHIPGFDIVESPTRKLYLFLVIHALNYYYERTFRGYGKSLM